jgi:hypothetical protein
MDSGGILKLTGSISPLVRTNPVTGWKSLFGAAGQVQAGWINGVTERESEVLKAYCKCLLLATV